jgi:hypothetical protein
VDQFEIDMLRHSLRSKSAKFVDRVNAAVAKPSWLLTARLNETGQTALHEAALHGDQAIVWHLLENCQCDPSAVDKDGCKPVDLVKGNEPISWILSQHENKATFNRVTCRLMEQNEVTALKLGELPQFMTSIYDLQVLFCLGYGALSTAEMKQLVQDAFVKAVDFKLMFDDDALTFFKTVLRECNYLRLISQQQKDRWEIQAGHVNGSNADWVRALQNEISQLEHRLIVSESNILSLNKNFHALRSALEAKIRLDDERQRRRQLIRLVTCGLLIGGGSVLEGAFLWAFEACESAEASLVELTETSSDELASTVIAMS